MSSLRVLIVDDEKDNIDALKRLLRRDFEVLSASSGEDALEILHQPRKAPLDVVVSDQRMPGIQGSELLEKTREYDPLITRILLTGFSDIEAVVEAVNRGQIWRYIAKPWEPDDLVLTIRQAAERSRLQRSLQDSRLELERALNGLRAKDWARERLLQILLHEFRTAPQVLEAIRALDGGGPDAGARLRFIENLEKRFNTISSDISELMAEEKKISLLPKETLDLKALVESFAQGARIPLILNGTPEGPRVLGHGATLTAALAHFQLLLAKNTAKAPVTLTLEWDGSAQGDVFINFLIQGTPGTPPLPEGLAQSESNASLAWPLLLEPFVGHEDFTQHSTGLRVQSARVVRHMTALGARMDIQVSAAKGRIELLIVFKKIT